MADERKASIQSTTVELFLTAFVIFGPSRISSETPDISISNQNISWDNAVASGYPLLSWEFISQYGWDIVLPYLPIDESLWIGARANKTPYVEWKGCVEWLGNDTYCGQRTYGGSIGDCIQHCPKETKFYLLQDLFCLCVNDSECFRRTQSTCTTPCSRNPTDRCGGQADSASAYFKGPFELHLARNASVDDNDCVLMKSEIPKSNNNLTTRKQLLPQRCQDLFIKRYVCTVNTSVSAVTRDRIMSWQEAFEFCQDENEVIEEKQTKNTAAWTMIRRSTHILWGQGYSKAPYCTSMSKTKDNKLTIHSEYCNTKHRYLYLIMIANYGSTAQWQIWKGWFVISVVTTMLLIFIVTTALCEKVLRIVRRRRQTETLHANPFYATPSVVITSFTTSI